MRRVDKNYGINEDLVGVVEVEMTDAATLTSTLKDVLLRCNLQLAQCRVQAYDGASNMAGHLSGVSTRITNEEPKTLYVHCMFGQRSHPTSIATKTKTSPTENR